MSLPSVACHCTPLDVVARHPSLLMGTPVGAHHSQPTPPPFSHPPSMIVPHKIWTLITGSTMSTTQTMETAALQLVCPYPTTGSTISSKLHAIFPAEYVGKVCPYLCHGRCEDYGKTQNDVCVRHWMLSHVIGCRCMSFPGGHTSTHAMHAYGLAWLDLSGSAQQRPTTPNNAQ